MRRTADAAKASMSRSATRPVKRNLAVLKRNLYLGILNLYRIPTGRMRVLPDFIIFGAQKCGTSSLYNYLTQHPQVARALRKEIHYFTQNFEKGITWYKAHFPLLLYKRYCRQIRGHDILTGEASPNYMFLSTSAKRTADTLPNVKLIALLRNPVDRAYSHYHHVVRAGFETLSFEDAISCEEERLRGEHEKILADENYHSFNLLHYSYLSRGIYADQLDRWMSHFSPQQVLILRSEDLDADPEATTNQVFRFLDLPGWERITYRRYHTDDDDRRMDGSTRKRLLDYFAPHNDRLSATLGMKFDWDR